jgi:hypothetical protein
MTENNTTTNTTPKAPKTAEQRQAEKAAREHAKKVYATADEAKANKPNGEREKWTLHRVTDPTGKTYFTWSFGREAALLQVVSRLGWTATEDAKAASPEKTAAMLASLTPEQRAALLAQYTPATPAPDKTLEKPTGRKAK